MTKLENIYEELKKNPHKSMEMFEEEKCIVAKFNVLENAISMLIDMSKYSNEVNLIHNMSSKRYVIISYFK